MNIISNIKKSNPNIYSLLIGVLTAVWFNGVSSMINILLPERGVYISLVMLIIPLIIFLLDNNSLSELNPSIAYPINTNLAQKFEPYNAGYMGYRGYAGKGVAATAAVVQVAPATAFMGAK